MDSEKFTKVFKLWNNETIEIKNLRLKCITLLALVVMLRPSDIAPQSVIVDGSGEVRDMQFTVDQLNFKADGSVAIAIHGNKNDTHRHGFVVDVTPASDVSICPVRTLRTYLQRTDKFRSSNGPVFISLRKPYGALSSSAIRQILNDAIETVGLSRNDFTAKSFRPTGATIAITEGFDPNVVQQIGRWKTSSVFFEHYVHSRVPINFTDKILKL